MLVTALVKMNDKDSARNSPLNNNVIEIHEDKTVVQRTRVQQWHRWQNISLCTQFTASAFSARK